MARVLPYAGTRPAVLAGALLMLGAMTLLATTDGLAKELGRRFPVWEVVWARYAFNLLALAPALLRHRPWHELWPASPALQLARGASLVTASALYFAALALMPLADALALTFVAPLT